MSLENLQYLCDFTNRKVWRTLVRDIYKVVDYKSHSGTACLQVETALVMIKSKNTILYPKPID